MNIEKLLSEDFVNDINATELCGIIPKAICNKISDSLYHITFSYSIINDCITESCSICISAPRNPKFTWSSHLTPEEGFIVQEHVFRTPGMIFGYQDKTLIFYPDLEDMKDYAGYYYIDADSPNGKMYFGISDSTIAGHVLYKKAGTVSFHKGNLKLSFYLHIINEYVFNPFKPILDYFWNNYGNTDALKISPAIRNPDKYIEHTYNWAFNNWKDIVWQEFQINGNTVGAPAFIVTADQSPNNEKRVSERELRSIWNQAWFCSLRSASGLYRYAKRTGSDKLLQYAIKTKELALSFPQTNGLFDSVIATEMKDYNIDGINYWQSAGWNTKYFGNSNRNPFTNDPRKSPKHILDMSFTAEYMLIWYEELEEDQRLLNYAIKYADKLLSLQYGNGFFPAWINDDGTSNGIFDDSPETAMSTVFLLHISKLTNDLRYKSAALKSIEALEKNIIFDGRWEDFETYWSCSRFWSDNSGKKIHRNNMYKQCSMSMFYTAWALLESYLATDNYAYLNLGNRVIDEMLMLQSSYQPKRISVPVVGGFGVMNCDAELNDARQSLFSELIIRYGKILNDESYIERGKAAMRMSFSMMYCPENPETKEQWEKVWPFFNDKDYGFMMENYGHDGKINDQGLGIGCFTIYDWGNGAAAECYERIRSHFGEEFIQNERRIYTEQTDKAGL